MSTLTLTAAQHADRRRRIWAIVASSSGNLVEWYDFYAYAFTALYFAKAFFPEGDQTTQLLQTAAVFAIGFLMRPIGGYIFGRVADRYGRKTSMIISILMMCAGSLAIGLLPTHATIGVAAPVLLLLLRMVQGLSVGGEYGTTATYMSEVGLPGQRGFFASFQYVTLIGGQLLASLVVLVIQTLMTDAELRAWGWRIPFFIGALCAVVALYLRLSLHETSSEKSRSDEGAGSLRAIFTHHLKPFLLVVGYTAGGSLIFYTFTTYMQKYLVNTAHMDLRTVNVVMTLVLFTYMLMQPPFGALSDRIGRRTQMRLFGVLATVGTVPLLYAIGGVTSPYMAYVLIVLALAIVSLYTSISGVVKAEMFPPEVRALSVGFGYAIANALFGGSAEYVALWFKDRGSESNFYWYVAILCAVALVAAIVMPDPKVKGYLHGHESDPD
jgi:MHS family alpha-ketoglutarate permease-like MFS transporter